MRQYLILAVLIVLTLTSCKKDNSNNTLDGKWRMISVKDIATNTTSIKPSNINGNVDITFTLSTSATDIMTGVTPTNSLRGDFTIGRNNTISVTNLSQTKVMETSWGAEFLDNIRSSQSYFFDGDKKLNINTSTNKILIFIVQ